MASWLCCLASLVAVPPAHAEVARGWEWTTPFPFREMTAVASSEQADRWPAAKAIDGDTGEPDGLWQTLRDSPRSAWLELRLKHPRRIAGVRIFHQAEPRYYRSVDYTVSCWLDGQWSRAADVKGNRTAGWREHLFTPVETAAVRIDISKSEYGYRMGLNEVALVFAPEPEARSFVRLSLPYRCGRVPDMGAIAFEATVPEGCRIDLRTRSAPDACGKPGDWSSWSDPYTASGEPIASPLGEWVQYQATYVCSTQDEPALRWVRLGSPLCLDQVRLDTIIPRPGEPLTVGLRFRKPMDVRSKVAGELSVAGRPTLTLRQGRWDADGRIWCFTPVPLGPGEGLATLRLGGARRRDGRLMMHEEHTLLVGTQPLLNRLRGIADWMMAHEQPAIFVEGYNERTLLGLYEITGEQRYLDRVRRWAGKLLDAQKPAGYWGTGYGDVYFADTGSALGLLVNFHKFATPQERARIDAAFERYFDLLLVTGDSTGKPFVHPDGSLGVGYRADKEGHVLGDLNRPYTISTALTGAEIFAAWYYLKGDEQYKRRAIRACDWVLDTMAGPEPPDPYAQPGQIPYYIDDWNRGRTDRVDIWVRSPYDTSAYAGEGFIAAWTYIRDEPFRSGLGRRLRPHVDWLLRTQNPDGSWAQRGSGDQLRSHGVVNLLLWYYENVERDPDIASALSRYCRLLVDEDGSAYLNVPGDGIATSLAGRALVDVIRPGVDCYRWLDGPTPKG